ncbi:MAG: Ferritin, Dps family protein [Caldanaerobacter subterraneus]|jgi:bacterioferritin|uniref:Ferritin, Dps family protein n=2 Tax=Thermoanaerobacter TaxID=1754 RepID=B0KCZ7_THEP3|nr:MULTISPECIES: ferritin-like domain-containing protein [Thermoanaerobacter]KUK34396.1 MAG: Ferritin, Dps family protein [Caldanaerobacter subterraneus]ABY92207.1 Ferritin, Dps family protein [Thermoanaerobacter sp. X514]ABY94095.1 Ferritin, Dps family protein [Thermoanaerobacter pseudethanolicus ATCC 33223]ADV79050.1 Ferritin Dps family protein [Thermoanaerobacter brockii subsp. finnii Ako-1]MBZ4655555.1 Ferritin, Dps family protein [Thermoanaerobacter sp.]
MGTKGREIVGKEVDKIIEFLNKALADEWLAYYQYWIGAKVVRGPMSGAVAAELSEHAGEELSHAEKLAERIIQLGGTPILKPEDWYKLTNCGYDTPDNPEVKVILEQNIKGEQCAIEVYNKMLSELKDVDPVTYHLILEILEDEIEHEEDLENLKEDMDMMNKK